ncbi:hypothetical protein G6F57_006867 [Rhizopus arrhizus]|uniref:PH domain-containing protein n=1 Tax=Rhizopus oryzae TaxID=64495 RepID=A0A9P7BTE2_RHIOR|nr:hypothetical protein G6F23_001411 [Rhizopus arrhizus]KAG1423153.1 hypothetical protein G6F58_002952 [Rhizopus delemar]KAG0764430.1 hypothetical protein G6F24_005227 [Rhizopus arrhizus]KAG0792332.1 hypothetical protein G6F21_004436 [Rhizopus arrhizus]KAG0801618.1 hypothetical protein G6F22_001072 [Rhizopus arrhizus]
MTDINYNGINKEESDENNSEYTPSPRLARRPVTMSTRRSSRLLYLEKYGLNQPGWHSSDNLNDYDNDSSEEESPQENIEEQRKKIKEYKAQPTANISSPVLNHFAPNTQPICDASLKRPVSIRNYVQTTSAQKRPSRFVKPINSATSIGKVVLPPTEFIHVHKLLEAYEKKVYIEGYLQKRNDLKSDGSLCNAAKWSIWYIELCGPILSLWDASSSSSDQDVFPQYINITDSTVNIEANSTPNTFSLNSAGANRYILQALDSHMLRCWVSAIRLSCFECSRIQEIYTRTFISRSNFSKCLNTPKKPRSTTTGFLHARFPNGTGWKQYWVSVSNEKKQKGLFGKKKVPTSARILFYDSKKSKYPVMTVQQVVQAYTVYPESPKLINMATLFKIEGSLYKNGHGSNVQLVNASAGILLMAPTANELVEWLVQIYDTFQLYGRPNSLLNDPFNPKALNFGEATSHGSSTRLFLEIEEVNGVNIEGNLLNNKAEFSTILSQKLRGGLAPLRTERSIVAVDHARLPKPAINVRHSRALTCASDVSDEEDEKSESETDSDDDSLFKLGTKPVKSKSTLKQAPELPTSNSNTTSKSSSEISEISSSNTIAGTTHTLLAATHKSSMDDDFSSSILSNPVFNNTTKVLPQQQRSLKNPTPSDTNVPKSLDLEGSSSRVNEDIQRRKVPVGKGQRKRSTASSKPYIPSPRASVVSPVWSMNHSAASVINPDYSSQWETSSVDPRMMAGAGSHRFSNADIFQQLQQRPNQTRYTSSVTGYNPQENDYDDDDTPIANRHPTRNNASSPINNHIKTKKIDQNYTRSNSPMTNNHFSPNGFVNRIDEMKKKEGRKSMIDDQNIMWNRLMMEQRQQQLMMQQCMQQYNMMPMMMPVMDPRLLPQPYMMVDPRFMPPSPMMMPPSMRTPSPTTNANTNAHSFRNSQCYSKDIDLHRRYEKRNMSLATSVADSVYAAESQPRRTKN